MNRDIKELSIISCHLGSGASISAIDRGVSVENSMGFTPLEGLVMGTRCGDLDPGIVPFLAEKEDMTAEGINQVLNHESGILGLSGISSDYLEVVEGARNGIERAKIALEVFYYRVRKYIGSYTAVMGGIDAIVFTGGIGENNADAREEILNGLEFLGIRLNNEANQVKGGEKEITTEDSLVKVFAIPTNEELVIARDTERLAGN
jgi:acetate kinase